MRKLAIIRLIIVVLIVVASGYSILKILPSTLPAVASIIFILSITWSHELGHLFSAKWLGYHPSALCISYLIIPSGVFWESTRNNKKHGKIVKASGPLGSLIAFVFFGVMLNQISSLPLFVLVAGLIMALLESRFDFIALFSRGRHRSDSNMLNFKINLQQQGRAWLLVFSEERWKKSKTKMEQQIGRKINFREIILG